MNITHNGKTIKFTEFQMHWYSKLWHDISFLFN